MVKQCQTLHLIPQFFAFVIDCGIKCIVFLKKKLNKYIILVIIVIFYLLILVAIEFVIK